MEPEVRSIEGEVPTNGAEQAIAFTEPYTATVTLRGTSIILFHRWNVEAVQEKADAAKGSKAKKTDNVESYVWRNDKGEICLPGEYVRQSIINAAKYRQDPRSPRKSAMELFKAGIVALTDLAPLLTPERATRKWDHIDMRRVTIQKGPAITRHRPAFNAGWSGELEFAILLPEYIGQDLLLDVINKAGKLVGVGDNRPTYGRYSVTGFKTRLGV